MARICFVCISLRAGGTERVVTRLANGFCRDHDVSIVIAHKGSSFYELDPKVNLYTYKQRQDGQAKWRRGLNMMRHIRSAIHHVEPDVILSFGELISPIARIATLGSGARFMVFNRESPLRSLRGRAGIVNPLTYPLADCVVTQTEKARSLLRPRYRFSRFQVIPNPVEIPQAVPAIESRPKRIISVGYLGGEKNQQALLRAFSQSSSRDSWEVAIIGDGPDRDMLMELSRDLGIHNQVEFLGERKDVATLLKESRIFAFTSLSEGFPNALSEGLAHGCACIAYDCVAGPSELITHNSNGLLIPAGDQNAYSEALKALMRDENMQSRFSTNARQDIRRFSRDEIFQQYVRLVLSDDQHKAKGSRSKVQGPRSF